jgi:hypothetical protein
VFFLKVRFEKLLCPACRRRCAAAKLVLAKKVACNAAIPLCSTGKTGVVHSLGLKYSSKQV